MQPAWIADRDPPGTGKDDSTKGGEKKRMALKTPEGVGGCTRGEEPLLKGGNWAGLNAERSPIFGKEHEYGEKNDSSEEGEKTL